MDHLINFVFIIGFSLCGFIIFGLIKTKKNELPQRLLITFWLFIIFIILTYYADLHTLRYLYVISYPFLNTSQIFLPVVVYLYLKSIFFQEHPYLKLNLAHLLPTTLYLMVYTLPILINYTSDRNIFQYVEQIDTVTLTLIKDTYGILYFILSIRLLRRVQGKVKHLYSNLTKVQYSWLNKFVFTFFGVIIIDFLFTLSEFTFDYNVSWDGYLVVISLVISMFYLAYYGIKQVTLFIPEFLLHDPDKVKDPKEFVELDTKLKALFQNERPFLTPNLTLKELADQLNITDKTLSNFLNSYLKISFYDFVNTYRVKEAIEKLKSDDVEKYSIAGIGSLSGFSSKSSFYRIFKNETGYTPLNYHKQMNKES